MASVVLLPKDTYLAMIRNSEGTNLFRHVYALVDGKHEDITDDGNRSCAVFVASILHQFGLVRAIHTGVAGLERDMRSSGWRTIEMPEVGDVLFWEPVEQASGMHAHCGFFLGGDEAISNRDTVRTPAVHHLTFGTGADGAPVRKVTAVYTHDFLRSA